jgi:hypothetical protein
MPANAGIQVRFQSRSKTAWIPACAGMTGTRVAFQAANSEPRLESGRSVPIDPQTNSLYFNFYTENFSWKNPFIR